MNSKYLNDQWTLEDDLGIAGTGDLLARIVLEVQPPFSMRVTGKWGSGKTSVLRRAFATLGGQPIQLAVPLSENNITESGLKKWATNIRRDTFFPSKSHMSGQTPLPL